MTIRIAMLASMTCTFVVMATSANAGEPIPGVDVELKSNRAFKPSSGGIARATTVKSSKSNTSDRMGGGGGKSGPAYLNPQPEPPGKAKIRR